MGQSGSKRPDFGIQSMDLGSPPIDSPRIDPFQANIINLRLPKLGKGGMEGWKIGFCQPSSLPFFQVLSPVGLFVRNPALCYNDSSPECLF
jgi:hypothetical protein